MYVIHAHHLRRALSVPYFFLYFISHTLSQFRFVCTLYTFLCIFLSLFTTIIIVGVVFFFLSFFFTHIAVLLTHIAVFLLHQNKNCTLSIVHASRYICSVLCTECLFILKQKFLWFCQSLHRRWL